MSPTSNLKGNYLLINDQILELIYNQINSSLILKLMSLNTTCTDITFRTLMKYTLFTGKITEIIEAIEETISTAHSTEAEAEEEELTTPIETATIHLETGTSNSRGLISTFRAIKIRVRLLRLIVRVLITVIIIIIIIIILIIAITITIKVKDILAILIGTL